MQLFIKNMVCERCKMMVGAELRKLGLNPLNIKLGEIELHEGELSAVQLEQFAIGIGKLGFELLTDKKKQLVAQVKSLLIDLVHYHNEVLNVNLSSYLSEKLNSNYPHLSAVFSAIENDTIEQFFIRQKIEKVKELLTYGEKSLGEIAYKLNYRSVAHLSAQFKKITNQTASAYKANKTPRTTLDQV